MTDWLAADITLQHVLAHELVLDVARSKLEREVRRGGIPAKATLLRYGGTETSDAVIPSDFWTSPWRHVWIDFASNTARSRVFGVDGVYLSEDTAAGVAFSERHVFPTWPKIEEPAKNPKAGTPRRPKGTGRQRTDAKLVKRMRKLITGGLVNNRTEAARAILKQDKTFHGQSEAGTIKRLTSRYAEHYGE
jgi:hypothetical protein